MLWQVGLKEGRKERKGIDEGGEGVILRVKKAHTDGQTDSPFYPFIHLCHQGRVLLCHEYTENEGRGHMPTHSDCFHPACSIPSE